MAKTKKKTIPSVGKDVGHLNADTADESAMAQALWKAAGKFPVKHTIPDAICLLGISPRERHKCVHQQILQEGSRQRYS